VVLRPVDESDDEFLLALYGSTRAHEMADLPWSEQQKHSFIRMQNNAKPRFDRNHFVGARHLIVERDGRRIGRLYVDRNADEIRIVDIALVPEFRGRGIGAALIGDVFAEARASGLPVRIHVEKDNPALRLYDRLGFTPIADQGVYCLMEWTPGAAAPVIGGSR
jgi:ribosomal protein S18 acetylase RimI-like enzyme